jgi:hypothetical protein
MLTTLSLAVNIFKILWKFAQIEIRSTFNNSLFPVKGEQ